LSENHQGRNAPLHRVGLPEQVASSLIKRIIDEGLPPGSALPTEQDLLREFGVGKSVIREAIRIVKTKGLVDVQQGSGMRVAPQSRWNLIDPELVAILGRSLLTMDHLIEVRRSVEPDITAFAAQRVTDEQLVVLADIVASMPVEGDDRRAYAASDLAFHDGLASATGNPLYKVLLGSINDLLALSRQGLARSRGARERGLYHHQRILEALRLRDAGLARARMVEHLDQVSEDWHSDEALAAVQTDD
jgi:GntR family transcriptional repressor for pyruvate dehydrogenase complex